MLNEEAATLVHFALSLYSYSCLSPLPILSLCVSVGWVRGRYRYLHVGVLFHGRESREIDPRGVVPVAMIVSLLFQLTKRGAAKPGEVIIE